MRNERTNLGYRLNCIQSGYFSSMYVCTTCNARSFYIMSVAIIQKEKEKRDGKKADYIAIVARVGVRSSSSPPERDGCEYSELALVRLSRLFTNYVNQENQLLCSITSQKQIKTHRQNRSGIVFMISQTNRAHT